MVSLIFLEINLLSLGCKEKMPKEYLGHNFQIPRKHICHDDFDSILKFCNRQGENIVNNNDFMDANI